MLCQLNDRALTTRAADVDLGTIDDSGKLQTGAHVASTKSDKDDETPED